MNATVISWQLLRVHFNRPDSRRQLNLEVTRRGSDEQPIQSSGIRQGCRPGSRRLEENLVALCDTDQRRAEPWRKDAPEVPWYQDFRRMLDEQDKRLDGVMAALPCHTHGVVAAAGMRRGKHVYIGKPIGHHMGELRALRQIAAEQNVASQMGNQGMATDSFRRTVELVRDGAIGEIRKHGRC